MSILNGIYLQILAKSFVIDVVCVVTIDVMTTPELYYPGAL